MSVGMIGTKLGMTQVFDEAGNTVPVTVIEAEPNVVVQRKTVTPDGYEAIQVGYGDRRRSRTNGPLTGHFGKAGVQPKRVLREFHTSPGEEFEAGQQITLASIFSAADGASDRHQQGQGVRRRDQAARVQRRERYARLQGAPGAPV